MPKNTDSLRDEIRLERDKLKGRSFSERLSYFLYYYKFHVLLFGALSLLVAFGIISVITRKDTVLYVTAINSDGTADRADEFCRCFSEYAGIDSSREDTVLETTLKMSAATEDSDEISDGSSDIVQGDYNTMIKFVASMSAGALDGVIADDDIIDYYGRQGYFQKLEDYLPSDMYKRLVDADSLLFVTDENGTTAAVGIRLSNSEGIRQAGLYHDTKDICYAVTNPCPHADNALLFARYLLGL